MTPSSSLLIYNFILFISLIVAIKKYKRVCISTFLMLWLLITGIISFAYYYASNDYIRDYSNITFPPLMYLFICYLITLIPLFRFDDNKNNALILNKSQESLINKFTMFIIIVSFEPFLENLLRLPDVLMNNNLSSEIYDMRLEGKSFDHLSFIGRKLFRISTSFELLYPILLFYYLTKDAIKIKYIYGLIMVIVSFWIHELALGGRSNLVQNMFYLLTVYFLMYRYLNKKINHLLIKYGLIFGIIGVGSVMLISISRFNNMDDEKMTLFLWLGLYAGEGILNFSSLMWDVVKTTNGNSTFVLLLNILGFNDGVSVRGMWEMGDKLGIPGNIFYTYVGAFYKDFNIYAIFVISLITLVVTKLTNKSKKITLFQILLLCMCARIVCIPTFYTFSTQISQINALFSIIFALFLNSLKTKIKPTDIKKL